MLAVVVGVAGGAALWVGGDRTFVTHPVSLAVLGGAAVGVATWTGPVDGSPTRRVRWGLAWSLASYLLLGGWATAAPGGLAAGLWSVAWVPVTTLLAVLGLLAAGLRRTASVLGALTAAAVVAGALLVRPEAPFEGVATVAPDGWSSTAPIVVDALTVTWTVALLVCLAMATRTAVRASLTDRRRLARAAAVTSTAPCLVLACLGLAVLRDPGDVDPGTGSVAYLGTVAAFALLAAWVEATERPAAVRAVAAAWAASVVVLAGVAAAGPLAEGSLAVAVLAVVLVTALVGAGTVVALARFEAWSRPPPPRAVTRTVPGLSPRENDVLAATATGATNAAVAAELFLSERTVEQHLRSIFTKLDLGEHGGSNRRVRAAAIWWEHQRSRESA